MEKGEIVEFDKPSILLRKGEGHFFDLVRGSGKEEARKLMKLVRQ